MTVYNFCAGPAMLPPEVMKKAQHEFLNWQNLGVSVMEVSHRAQPYLEMVKKCEASLRRLMNISDEFEVLFMHGGGRGQFAAVPLNLHLDYAPGVYVENAMVMNVNPFAATGLMVSLENRDITMIFETHHESRGGKRVN